MEKRKADIRDATYRAYPPLLVYGDQLLFAVQLEEATDNNPTAVEIKRKKSQKEKEFVRF